MFIKRTIYSLLITVAMALLFLFLVSVSPDDGHYGRAFTLVVLFTGLMILLGVATVICLLVRLLIHKDFVVSLFYNLIGFLNFVVGMTGFILFIEEATQMLYLIWLGVHLFAGIAMLTDACVRSPKSTP